MDDPGNPITEEHVMGMTGIVETIGMVCGSGVDSEKYLLPAYLVRMEGIGPVLVGEDWLEDGPAAD